MMQFEVFAQGQNGASAVTDGVFDVGAEFGKGLAVALGDKHGVVAKALVAALLCGDAAIDDALKQKFAAIVNIGNGGAETGIAVRVALQFLEQGVTLKGIGRFGNIAEAIYFVKAEHLILTSEYGTNLR